MSKLYKRGWGEPEFSQFATMALLEMPTEILCEIALRLPHKDRPSFYRAHERFEGLFEVQSLRPDAVYWAHIAAGYTVEEVWRLIEKDAFDGSVIRVTFPPDLDMRSDKMWKKLIMSVCLGLEDCDVFNHDGTIELRRPAFMPEEATAIEVRDVPKCDSRRTLGIRLFRLMIQTVFVSDTRIRSLAVEYKEPEYEAWQFLAEFLSRYPTDNIASLEMVVELEDEKLYRFFTHVDGALDTYDKFYLVNLTRIYTRGHGVKRACLKRDDNENFVLIVLVLPEEMEREVD